MHIPDGFLSTPVWATLDVISLPAVAWMARKARRAEKESRAPLLGVLGAFVFAAQMINFPVAPGTSAHLLGGALLACTVGPAAAVVVMTAVLIIQALIFQDGGLLALGANVFNLAIVGSFAAWIPYSSLAPRFQTAGIFCGAGLSVLISGIFALAQLHFSGVPLRPPVTSLALGFFGVSAIIEGVITVAVIRAIGGMNPDWVRLPSRQNSGLRVLAAASVILVVFAFALASTQPDTLEMISRKAGIEARAVSLLETPFADYQFAGLSSEALAKISAGVVGIAIVFLICAATARLLKRNA